MKKYQITFIICIALFACGQCFGQNKKDEFRINKSLPSVYLSFDKIVEETKKDGKTEKYVSLKFHNNTRWSLILAMLSDIDGGISLFYDILDEDLNVIGKSICTFCSVNQLKKGKTIEFNIPLDNFENSSLIRIKYNYEWEDYPPIIFKEYEPTHYVYLSTDFLEK